MADALLRVALQRLHGRLSELVDRDVRLRCWLIEWPSMWAARESEKPGLADNRVVWESVDWEYVDWKTNETVTDPDGSLEEIFDSEGKLVADPVRMPNDDGVANKPFRALHVSVRFEGRDRLRPIFYDRLKPIFVDAGNLLTGIPADALPVPISSATMRVSDPVEKWLYFLFDVAWARLSGSRYGRRWVKRIGIAILQ